VRAPLIDEKQNSNTLRKDDSPVHGWYRFVLSYPPHLVRQYLQEFQCGKNDLIFDPFCGTGTTLVEAKKCEVPSVGCDAHPVAALVSRVKTNWSLDSKKLRKTLQGILGRACEIERRHRIQALSFDAILLQEERRNDRVNGYHLAEAEEKLLPTGFLSARPLQRLLIARDVIDTECESMAPEIWEFFQIALAHVIANGAGNFAFGPEIYRTKAKEDYDVLGHFGRQADLMIREMAELNAPGVKNVPATVHIDDARVLSKIPDKISAVITSPPYPNEKDYTRTTRVESIVLGLISDRKGLRQVKESLLRSNTRNIFVGDRDREEVKGFSSIQKICAQIEDRRVELKKDSGFEKLYHKVVGHYFGGMRRHFRSLRPKLRPDANLAYVVGDQLSFLMVPVPTADLLAEIATAEGYRVVRKDLWRERVGTKVRNDRAGRTTVRVREEILILKKR
jgi:DNA modification methylase